MKTKAKKDPNAPARPWSAYNYFCKSRMSAVKVENPNRSQGDVIRMVANEWGSLPQMEKQNYTEKARLHKEKYVREFSDYKKTDSYKKFVHAQKQKETKKSKGRGGGNVAKGRQRERPVSEEEMVVGNGLHVPIFTEDFLVHNRQRETTLRQLRKQVIHLEEETALLSKHVDTLDKAVERLQSESTSKMEVVNSLEDELTSTREKVSALLDNLPLPDTRMRASPATLDEYMSGVVAMARAGQHSEFVGQVKDALAKMRTST